MALATGRVRILISNVSMLGGVNLMCTPRAALLCGSGVMAGTAAEPLTIL